jgi:hypothetical protein
LANRLVSVADRLLLCYWHRLGLSDAAVAVAAGEDDEGDDGYDVENEDDDDDDC